MKRNRTSLVVTTACAAVAGVLCTIYLVRMAPVSPNIEPLKASIYQSNRHASDSTATLPDERELTRGDRLSSFKYLPEFIELSHQLSPWSTSVQQRKLRSSGHERHSSSSKLSGSAASLKPQRRQRHGKHTLASRLAAIAPTAKPRLVARFAAANVAWPPSKIALIALKDEQKLELYAQSTGPVWQLVHRYPVLAASGEAGPKLQRGDGQVPEGIYRITYLNPNSAFHVSLRVNYPNRFDRRMARRDGRRNLGGDIMIHGKQSSAGCLSMGDRAAEELFVLAAKIGKSNIKLIISPTDFRNNASEMKVTPGQPSWLPILYAKLASELAGFPKPSKRQLWSLFTQ